MAVSGQSDTMPEHDPNSDIQAFDESKIGVGELIHAGIIKIPNFEHEHLQEIGTEPISSASQLSIPVIDLDGLTKDAPSRAAVVADIRKGFAEWGLFQIINHGVPGSLLDQIIEGVRQFHEQDTEVKKEYYSGDLRRKVSFNSALHKAPASASWRDALYLIMAPDPPKPEELPEVCRDLMIEYAKCMMKLGHSMFELLSESLGLDPNHLNGMGCNEGLFILCNYYPPCPEPEKTIGLIGHTDSGFVTILLQDQIGGLQVLHENQWVDVPFLPGALIINAGDYLQLITNDKFKSVYHRALARKIGPRISVASFFRTHLDHEESKQRIYGPIKELLSEENPPLYRDATANEMLSARYRESPHRTPLSSHFKFRKQ